MNGDQYCVSPCLSCPICESTGLDKRVEEEYPDYYISEVSCWNCGEVWCEIDFYGDDEDE